MWTSIKIHLFFSTAKSRYTDIEMLRKAERYLLSRPYMLLHSGILGVFLMLDYEANFLKISLVQNTLEEKDQFNLKNY